MKELSTANLAQITSDYYELVLLAKFEFSDGTYCLHSSYGEIDFDGNTYLGVGDLGQVTAIREQSELGPSSLEFVLSGINPALVSVALDTSEYKAPITIYEGYRQDDGTLVDDPWIRWSGWWEHSTVNIGAENIARATAQHDIAILDERDGGRYSDEDQTVRYSSDRIFQYTPYMADLVLSWAGGMVGSVTGTPGGGGGGPDNPVPPDLR